MKLWIARDKERGFPMGSLYCYVEKPIRRESMECFDKVDDDSPAWACPERCTPK